MVGRNADQASALRIVERDHRSHLHIIGQPHDHTVRLPGGEALKAGLPHTEIFPLRNRPFDQSAPGSVAPAANLPGVPKPVEIRQGGRLPRPDIPTRVETDIRFGQPEIRMRLVRIPESRMDTTQPQGVAFQGEVFPVRRKQQSCPAAVLMGKTVLSEMPQQNGDTVLPLAQERSDVHPIVIGILGCRPPFQTPFEDDTLTVDPQPVFRIGRNAHRCGRRKNFQFHVTPECDPGVRKVRTTFRRGDPTGAGVLPGRRTEVLQRQGGKQAGKKAESHGQVYILQCVEH